MYASARDACPFRAKRLEVDALGVDRAALQVEPALRPAVPDADADAVGVQRPAVHRDPLVRLPLGGVDVLARMVSSADAVGNVNHRAGQDLDRAVVRPHVVACEHIRSRRGRAGS